MSVACKSAGRPPTFGPISARIAGEKKTQKDKGEEKRANKIISTRMRFNFMPFSMVG